MKNFIILIFILMIGISGYSQSDTIPTINKIVKSNVDSIYPQPYYKNDKLIGVLFTMKQAMKIDNDYELFYLLDSIVSQYGINDSITIGIINSQGIKIKNLETIIKNKEILLDNRNNVINELKNKISLYDKEIIIMKDKEKSYVEETKVLKKEVRRQKRQKIVGYIISGGIIILLILTGK